jgi:hypothetical protein
MVEVAMDPTEQLETITSDSRRELGNVLVVFATFIGGAFGLIAAGVPGLIGFGLAGAALGAVMGFGLDRVTRHAAKASEIEPACADCLEVRRESGGRVSWCSRHDRHRTRAHLHYEYPSRFGVGSTFIRPEG